MFPAIMDAAKSGAVSSELRCAPRARANVDQVSGGRRGGERDGRELRGLILHRPPLSLSYQYVSIDIDTDSLSLSGERRFWRRVKDQGSRVKGPRT